MQTVDHGNTSRAFRMDDRRQRLTIDRDLADIGIDDVATHVVSPATTARDQVQAGRPDLARRTMFGLEEAGQAEVFEAVASGRAARGVVPIEKARTMPGAANPMALMS